MMKHVTILILMLVLSLSMSPILNAASVGGKQPEQREILTGFEYNQITNKDVSSDPAALKEIADSSQQLARIEYGLLSSDNLNWSVFTKLGTADMEIDDNEGDTYSFGNEFAWGLGTKLVNKFEAFSIGMEGQYFTINDFSTSDMPAHESGDSLDVSDWREWQVSFFLAKNLEFENFGLMPYLGVKYSDMKADSVYHDNTAGTTTEYDAEADENVGIFVGTDLNFTDRFSANLEGRFVDETAFTVALNYRF